MDPWGKPAPDELAPFYHGYVDGMAAAHVINGMRTVTAMAVDVLRNVPEVRGPHRYAPDKWSLKEVVQHMIDTERIMAYRALRFARNDATELAGFDENAYAPESFADRRTLADLTAEFELLGRSSIALFEGFDPSVALRSGLANRNRMTVRAAGWVIAGHNAHHLRIIRDRYLNT